jgi:enoyl-CoA hydratase
VIPTAPGQQDGQPDARIDVHEGDVVLAVLDDGRVNALDRAVVRRLRDAVATASRLGVPLVVAGRPGVLSAGFDLGVVRAEDPALLPALLEECKQLVLDLVSAPVPVVVACTGHAVAAGALLLLCADRRIGRTGESRIGLNEVALGLVLPELALTLARHRLSPLHLGAATVHGRSWSAEEAVAVGFLDELAADPVAVAHQAAHELAALDRAAFATTRRLACAELVERLSAQTLAAPGRTP